MNLGSFLLILGASWVLFRASEVLLVFLLFLFFLFPNYSLLFIIYLNALRAYTATVPMTQYDVPEVSRRFRPHLPLHFAIQISEK